MKTNIYEVNLSIKSNIATKRNIIKIFRIVNLTLYIFNIILYIIFSCQVFISERYVVKYLFFSTTNIFEISFHVTRILRVKTNLK